MKANKSFRKWYEDFISASKTHQHIVSRWKGLISREPLLFTTADYADHIADYADGGLGEGGSLDDNQVGGEGLLVSTSADLPTGCEGVYICLQVSHSELKCNVLN